MPEFLIFDDNENLSIEKVEWKNPKIINTYKKPGPNKAPVIKFLLAMLKNPVANRGFKKEINGS